MPQTLQERAYRTNSGNVAYWVDASANTDMPWLVFLPGLTADHTLFDAQMAHFSGKAKMPGVGCPCAREITTVSA